MCRRSTRSDNRKVLVLLGKKEFFRTYLKHMKRLILFAFCTLFTAMVARYVRSAEGILDYNRFISEIEPLLLTETYASPGPSPMTCFACHGDTSHAAFTAFPLRMNEPRQNFVEASRHVEVLSPDTSDLLLKPLAIAAGGTPHGLNANDGGEQFANTTTDVAYRTIQQWIVDATRSSVGARITKTDPYPNPFRYGTNIVYFLTTEAEQVNVKIYSSNGFEVRHFTGTGNVGANRVFWDGRDADEEPLPTGVYFYSVKASFDNGTSLKTGRCVYTP